MMLMDIQSIRQKQYAQILSRYIILYLVFLEACCGTMTIRSLKALLFKGQDL